MFNFDFSYREDYITSPMGSFKFDGQTFTLTMHICFDEEERSSVDYEVQITGYKVLMLEYVDNAGFVEAAQKQVSSVLCCDAKIRISESGAQCDELLCFDISL